MNTENHELWSANTEKIFFLDALKVSTPEQLFYRTNQGRYFAYWPIDYKEQKSTLQSRNSLIGTFTEKFSVELLQHFADSQNLFAVQSVVCEEIGLTRNSPADVALCKTFSKIQKAQNIIAIFEVKMSIVWNWELINADKNDKYVKCIGDYRTHSGNPGLLRSDSMLKAIGKSINIRVSGEKAARIPIFILGNTPITHHYYNRVDHLKNAGIIQGFWSINPKSSDDQFEMKKTQFEGYFRFESLSELEDRMENTIFIEREFFSSMKSKSELGKIIEIANSEKDLLLKAEKFLSLLKETNVK